MSTRPGVRRRHPLDTVQHAPGGANFLFADGSIRFFRDATDQITVQSMGTIIMRFGIARQQRGALVEPDQAVGGYSLTTTLLASSALVAIVLGLVAAVLVWRQFRSNGRSRLAVYRDDDAPLDPQG